MFALQLALAGRREAVALGGHLGPALGARFDLLGEADLTLLGQQWILTDVGEIQPDEVFLVPFDPLLGHPRLLQPGEHPARLKGPSFTESFACQHT